jgi:hypothetical protein
MDRRSFSSQSKRTKLEHLASIEGFDTIEQLLEHAARDSVSPAICTSEVCDADTVASALILADLI